MIHASVHDTVDLPLVLAYMSTVKDVERIGDYSKNFYDLVKYGADFDNAPDHDELAAYRDRVSRLLGDAAAAFDSRDTDHARALIAKADAFLDEYDDHVKAAYRSTGTPGDAVSRALYYRFLKRITAHVMNFLTSIVLPVDRLDYYDEPKDDRESNG
jgi:phosphate uptake regulator